MMVVVAGLCSTALEESSTKIGTSFCFVQRGGRGKHKTGLINQPPAGREVGHSRSDPEAIS